MIKVRISEQDLETIKHERFNHPVPRVQRKMEFYGSKVKGCRTNRFAK